MTTTIFNDLDVELARDEMVVSKLSEGLSAYRMSDGHNIVFIAGMPILLEDFCLTVMVINANTYNGGLYNPDMNSRLDRLWETLGYKPVYETSYTKNTDLVVSTIKSYLKTLETEKDGKQRSTAENFHELMMQVHKLVYHEASPAVT